MASLFGDIDYSVYHPYNFSPHDSFVKGHEFLTRDMRGGKIKFGDVLNVGKKLVTGDFKGAATDVAVPLIKQGVASVTNLFQNHDNPLSTPTYPGEVRMPMKGDYAPAPHTGKRMLANYAGPGTHFLKRIKLGNKPVSLLDRISQAHDARYSLATTVEDVRKADQIFMARIEKEKNNLHPVEYEIVKKAFEAKMAAEDRKITKTQEAVLTQNVADGYTNADRQLMQGVLADLVQKGEGKKDSEISPSIRLARSIVTEGEPGSSGAAVIRKLKEKIGTRIKGKGLDPAGGGLKLAGQGGRGIIPFLKKGRKLHRLFVDHIRKYRPQLTPSDETHIETVVDTEFPTALSKVGTAVKKIAQKLHDHFGLPHAPLPDAAAIQEITNQAAVEEGASGKGLKSQLKSIGKKALRQAKTSASRLATDAKKSAAQIAMDTSSSLGDLAQQQINSASSQATDKLQALDSKIGAIVQRGLL